jgi:hypothetical protein
MFKKILVAVAIFAIIGVLVFGAVNRSQARSVSLSAGQGGYGRGSNDVISADQAGESSAWERGNGGKGRGQRGGINGAGELTNLPPVTADALSADESAALFYMREEEKLAHDVYVTLAIQWNLPIFQNISRSEQIHTDAVKALIDRYGLADPASSKVGIFVNPDLQKLYNDLVARGSQSLAGALKVGAAIEEIDILDLEKRLAQTDNADIQQVFSSLERGSDNHLRAFISTLNTQTGETYQPQYLSVAAYQAIVNGSASSGARNGQIGNGMGGGRRGGRP